MKLKFFLLAVSLMASVSALAQKWDAATCVDMCKILIGNGANMEEILVDKLDYEYYGEQDFGVRSAYVFCRNVNMDDDGNLLSLGKQGVSSVVYLIPSLFQGEYLIAFFSKTNTDLFGNQMFKMGFKKKGVNADGIRYIMDDIEVEESNDKVGRFSMTTFAFRAY